MVSALRVPDIFTALTRRRFPTVTTWNRCEARPRAANFDRALKAEVRDALWMLTKQWQLGEFQGSDAGSPIFAKVQLQTTRLTKYRHDGGAVELFERDLPIEAKVERRPLPLASRGRPLSLDLRLAMGDRWTKLVAPLDPTYPQAFVDAYGFAVPDPTSTADADICAHPEVWQDFAAVAGRAMDGGKLYLHLAAGAANHAYDGVAGVAAADQPAIDALATKFLASVARQFSQPTGGDDAWAPSWLEYQFAASAPLPGGGEKVYVADEFSQGRLDWFSLDLDGAAPALGTVPGSTDTGLPPDAPQTMMPIPVTFSGAPNTRWWSFEDGKTNYGDINAATTDLAKLLFLEFALVYANDWFVIPYTLPTGVLTTVRGVAVANVFGERLWIEAADKGGEADWKRWSLFTIDVRNLPNAEADPSLLLVPTVAKIQESAPTEEATLLRDEVANMVWGVEDLVPLANGESKRGAEAARQTRDYLTARLGGAAPPPAPPAAPIRYDVMQAPPEHWIPFIPVHVPANNRDVRLQRAALLRVIEGDATPPQKIEPRTVLLREGLDASQPYLIHEEEISRAGTKVSQRYARTRWTDGRVFTWLRVRRETGRGEGSSGLAFDYLKNVPSKTPS